MKMIKRDRDGKEVCINGSLIPFELFEFIIENYEFVRLNNCEIQAKKLTDYIKLSDEQVLYGCKLTNVRVHVSGAVDNVSNCIFE